MRKRNRRKLPFGWIALVLVGVLSLATAALGDSLVWDKQQKRVDAQVDSWNLATLLKKLSSATGWQIFVEPGSDRRLSVRFKNLPVGEALRHLLGDLNFALLPQTNAPSRLFIFRTSLQEATQLVAEEPGGAGTGSVIPNELVVTLRAGSKQTIDELARAFGAKVVGKLDGLNTYRLRFDDDAAAQAAREAMEADPDVASTDSNYRVERPTRVDNVELSSLASFSVKPKFGNPGNQVIVALIDTPVQPLDAKMSQFLLPAIHVAGEASPTTDLSHGTSMAQTILHGLTYAPPEQGGSSVRVLPVDVYGNSPETSTFDVANGIYAALASGATVINLSLGGEGDSRLLSSLIRTAHQQGILFFGAAGNQPTTNPTFPAAYPEVVAVTAGDRRGNIAPYANRGGFIDVIGPGLSLVDYQGQSYLVRGTSAATAYVSGTAAGYRASGNSAQNVETIIRETLALKPQQ